MFVVEAENKNGKVVLIMYTYTRINLLFLHHRIFHIFSLVVFQIFNITNKIIIIISNGKKILIFVRNSSWILFIYFLVSPRGEAGRRGGAKEEFRGD